MTYNIILNMTINVNQQNKKVQYTNGEKTVKKKKYGHVFLNEIFPRDKHFYCAVFV